MRFRQRVLAPIENQSKLAKVGGRRTERPSYRPLAGVGLAALLLVIGVVMTSNANFSKRYVTDQLKQEKITFKTADGKSQTLLLGPPPSTADKMCQAMLEGDSAVFAISGPDESALRLPLVQTAAPIPAATPQ